MNVNVSVGGTKKGKDSELDKVREQALMLANLIAGGILMLGQADDAKDVRDNAGAWADSVRELARHEDWLRKIAQGGEMTERALAWVGFLFATGAMLLPILLRHQIIPENLAELVSLDGSPVAAQDPAAPAAA